MGCFGVKVVGAHVEYVGGTECGFVRRVLVVDDVWKVL